MELGALCSSCLLSVSLCLSPSATPSLSPTPPALQEFLLTSGAEQETAFQQAAGASKGQGSCRVPSPRHAGAGRGRSSGSSGCHGDLLGL